nr:hypothetical protein [Tanacetum cinerariifolium]
MKTIITSKILVVILIPLVLTNFNPSNIPSIILSSNLEEKQLEEEQAAKAQNWKLPVCYDDDDDEEISNSLEDNIIFELPSYSAITPSEPIDSLSMGDEHLDTILATKSDEFIKSCVENLFPNPSESEGENECDVPAGFTTFSNVLFDVNYDFDSGDDQSTSDDDFLKKTYSNPLFDEEIFPMKIDQHPFIAESDLIGSMPNHDSSITISSKIDSLFDEFTGELTLLKSIPLGIDETGCHLEKEIRLAKRLLYDNSSPRPPEEIISDNSNADIESFSPSPIPNEDSDSHMEEIDLPLISVKENSRKGQNWIKTGQKQEVWQSREKSEAVTVDRGRKTEENTKRRAVNAHTCKVYQSFTRRKKEKGQNCIFKKVQSEGPILSQLQRCVTYTNATTSTSNSFDVLNTLGDEDDCGGMNPSSTKEAEQVEGNGKKDINTSVPSSSYYKPLICVVSSAHGSSHVASVSLNTTPLPKRINKLERKMLDGKLTLVDDDGKPLNKVDYNPVNSDSESDVEVAYDETAHS